jgi:hypothetical protein
MTRILKNISKMKWTAVAVCTFISFFMSLLFFDQRELMSEYLIVNSLYINSISGMGDWAGIFFYDGQPYSSQFGIHAFLFSIPLFAGVNMSNAYILLLIFLSTVMFYYVIVSITIEIEQQFGRLSSLMFLIFMFLNPIFLLNSGNLYWLYFLYILPFYFGLKYYQVLSDKKFYFYLTFLFTLKFVVNFEYASTVVISVLIPIALKLRLQCSDGLKAVFKQGVFVFISSLVSFSLVLMMLVMLLSAKSDNAASQFQQVISSYISGGNNEPHFLKYENTIIERNDMYQAVYRKPSSTDDIDAGWSSVLAARNTYEGYASLTQYISFHGKIASFYSILFIFFSFGTAFLIFLYLTNLEKYLNNLNALLLALASSFSWIIIMPLHFYLHSVYWRGISDVVLLFPFYSTVILLLGLRYNKLFQSWVSGRDGSGI